MSCLSFAALPLVHSPPEQLRTDHFIDMQRAKDYECAICYDTMGECIKFCARNHSFCSRCNDEWAKKTNKCPLCNGGRIKLVHNQTIEDAVKLAHVHCFTRSDLIDGGGESSVPAAVGDACEWTGPSADAIAHFAVCPFAGGKCSQPDCDVVVLRGALPSHEKTCEHRTEECTAGCGRVIKIMAMGHHISKCPKRLVRCPNTDAGCDADLMCFETVTLHRETCLAEEIPCLFQRTAPFILRRDMEAHWQELRAHMFSEDPALQLNKTQLLRRALVKFNPLVEHNPPIQQVVESGVVPRLVEFLDQDHNPPLQYEAARALTNIASGTVDHKRCLADAGAVPAFVRLLTSPNKRFRGRVLRALSRLSDGPDECIQAMVTAGVTPCLVELLRSPFSSLLIPALRTVGNIVAGDVSQTQVMIDLNALPALLLLMDHRKPVVRQEACWALSNVTAGTADQIQSVINAGLFPKLVELLRSSNPNVHNQAARAASNATNGGTPEQVLCLVGQGVVPPLCALLTVADAKVVTVALQGLENVLEADECGSQYDESDIVAQITVAGGLDAIEALQSHENPFIARRAKRMLETFFPWEN